MAILALIACGASLHRRRARAWHWPGVGRAGVLRACAASLLGLFFLGAAAQLGQTFSPELFPWFAAACALILFNVLTSLKFVCMGEAEFAACCGSAPRASPPAVHEVQESPQRFPAGWRRVVGNAYGAVFVVLWIAGVGFFWVFNAALRDAPHSPTPERTATLYSHGVTAYITPAKKHTIDTLQEVLLIGVPIVLLLGAGLQFGAGIRVFDRVKPAHLARAARTGSRPS